MSEFYQLAAAEAMRKLGTSEKGLGEKEAEKRLVEFGRNVIEKKEKFLALKIFLSP
jgi:magnesium-transporting ATPase (P-type)